MEDGNQTTIPIGAVSLKLPPFWTEDPESWFLAVEAQLRNRAITTDSTKFDHVVGVLDGSTMRKVRDIVRAPPAANKFQTLKDRLCGSFQLSKAQKVDKLIHMQATGDQKPSALLADMLALLDDEPAAFIFRRLFLDKLPETTRIAMHAHCELPLDQLAAAADAHVHESSRAVGVTLVNAVKQRPVPAPRTLAPKSTPAPIHNKVKFFCFYHSKFASGATKCEEGCQFNTVFPGTPKVPTTAASGNAPAGRT